MARNQITVPLPVARPYSPDMASRLPLSMQLAPARPQAGSVTMPLAAATPAADLYADTGLHGIGARIGNFAKLAWAQPTSLDTLNNGINAVADGADNLGRGLVGASTVQAARAEQRAASNGGSVPAIAAGTHDPAGGFMDLPYINGPDDPSLTKVQMPSQAWLAAHPAEPVATSDRRSAAMAGLPTMDPNGISQSVADYATANGGKMSLRALASLSHSLAETSAAKTQPKDAKATDLAGTEMLKDALALEDVRKKEIEAAPADKRAALTASAVKEKHDMLMRILGPNRMTPGDYAPPADPNG